jgi:ubiquinone/menaquinone biosynthesis C-methylase UbiE
MNDTFDPFPKQPPSLPKLHRLRSWFSAIVSTAEMARVLKAQIARADQMDVLFEELKQHVWDSFRRIDEAKAELNQRLDEINQRLEGISRALESDRAHAQGLKREIMFQQRRLSRLGEELSTSGNTLPKVASDLYDERIDSLYVAFEDVFRGSRDDIKSRLAPYLEQVKIAGAGSPGKPILDIGCGRGEWLELLQEHHLEAYGVDLNSMMVERCKSLGFRVLKADAVGHLRELPDNSLTAITAFHFIEHIPFDIFVNFLDDALRVLAPGGVLILETPNPETIRVGATTFYYDPTHRNPLPPVPTRFIVEHRGFVDVEIIRLHPVMEERLQALDENSELLNRVLFGPQDYAIIARRDGELHRNSRDAPKIAVNSPTDKGFDRLNVEAQS